MRKTKITILMIVLLSFSAIPFSLFIISGTGANTELPDYQGVDWQSGLAGDVAMPDLSDYQAQMLSDLQTASRLQTSQAQVGDTVLDWYLYVMSIRYGAGSPFMTLRAIGDYAEVWVADDLSYGDGDPRNSYPDNFTITDEMCEYLVQEVDDIIYPICSEYFGMSQDRDGIDNYWGFEWCNATDNPQRIMIKVFNIVDENYFDPTWPYFAIGFYSQLYSSPGYYNRNLIHLDSWQWWLRLGEEGTSWLPGLFVSENNQYNYDSTTAHEYQHLIHSDYQPDPESWMNEGCSMYSEFLCGYGLSESHVNSYFATPDNSLTIWGDQGDINILADYGVAALWTMYLSDQYGGSDTIRQYVQSGITGTEGVDAALAYYGYEEDFLDVYHDFRIANLIRSGDGKYNYHSVDLTLLDPIRVYDVSGATVDPMRGTDFGNTITTLGYDTGAELVGAFGTDYICFPDIEGFVKIKFNGDNDAFYGWRYTGDNMWWTGMAAWLDTNLVGEAFVDPLDPTLTINTYWDIEWAWDYGFVQISADGGATWTSLENAYTTYYTESDFTPITDNLPGISGDTDDWVVMDFDLSAYAGATVQIRFRYMTDPYVTFPGWYIEWAELSGNPLDLQVAGEYPAANYMVTLVKRYTLNSEVIVYKIEDIHLSAVFLGHENEFVFDNEDVFLLVSPTMLNGEADYIFSVKKLGWKNKYYNGW